MRENEDGMKNTISNMIKEQRNYDIQDKQSKMLQKAKTKYFSQSHSSLKMGSKLAPMHQKLAFQAKLGDLLGESLKGKQSSSKVDSVDDKAFGTAKTQFIASINMNRFSDPDTQI